jgi:transposase
MLGPAKLRRLDQPIAVSLEDLVPPNHFYRRLEARLDLSFFREWVSDLYAERGRPSIDPVFFKLQLVMFFEGIQSEHGTPYAGSGYGACSTPISRGC